MGLAAGFMAVCSAVLLVWSENIISIFNADPDLVKTGSVFLRIAVAGYLGLCIVFVMQNCISGSGDTLPPMLITLADALGGAVASGIPVIPMYRPGCVRREVGYCDRFRCGGNCLCRIFPARQMETEEGVALPQELKKRLLSDIRIPGDTGQSELIIKILVAPALTIFFYFSDILIFIVDNFFFKCFTIALMRIIFTQDEIAFIVITMFYNEITWPFIRCSSINRPSPLYLYLSIQFGTPEGNTGMFFN